MPTVGYAVRSTWGIGIPSVPGVRAERQHGVEVRSRGEGGNGRRQTDSGDSGLPWRFGRAQPKTAGQRGRSGGAQRTGRRRLPAHSGDGGGDGVASVAAGGDVVGTHLQQLSQRGTGLREQREPAQRAAEGVGDAEQEVVSTGEVGPLVGQAARSCRGLSARRAPVVTTTVGVGAGRQ